MRAWVYGLAFAFLLCSPAHAITLHPLIKKFEPQVFTSHAIADADDTITYGSYTTVADHGGGFRSWFSWFFRHKDPVNGMCGSADGGSFKFEPKSGLCKSGNAAWMRGNGPWTWYCVGENGGSRVDCSAQKDEPPVAVNGMCGAADGNAVSTKPSASLCNAGSATSITGAGPWAWSCAGKNGGSTARCVAPIKVVQAPLNGVCGSASGIEVTVKPVANLCGQGAASAVAGNGPWSWTCNGSNGGKAAQCAAPTKVVVVNGICGGANGVAVARSR